MDGVDDVVTKEDDSRVKRGLEEDFVPKGMEYAGKLAVECNSVARHSCRAVVLR